MRSQTPIAVGGRASGRIRTKPLPESMPPNAIGSLLMQKWELNLDSAPELCTLDSGRWAGRRGPEDPDLD